MAIGDEQPETIPIVNWHDLYNRVDSDDAIIPGVAFRGRWTAIAAAAKAGKSTVILALAYQVVKQGMVVLYLDAEMGRGDILDRVEEWMDLKPDDLANLHYSDLPPHLDTVAGSAALYHTVEQINPDLVIIDGLNGVASGAENDDTTWRDLFDLTIMPMKQRNIAVVSADNLGKDKTLGPRGHSAKMDKADAIIQLERTDNGVKLTATHRRTASYPNEQTYIVEGASEDPPALTIRRTDFGDYPAGTREKVEQLDRCDIPMDASKRVARRMLAELGEVPGRNDVLVAALRYRREVLEVPTIGPSGPHRSPGPAGTPLKSVPNGWDHSEGTPAQTGGPDGVFPKGHPPVPSPPIEDENESREELF